MRTLAADATKTDHKRAFTAAEGHAKGERAAVENGEWKNPKQEGPARLTFAQLVKKFLTRRSRNQKRA